MKQASTIVTKDEAIAKESLGIFQQEQQNSIFTKLLPKTRELIVQLKFDVGVEGYALHQAAFIALAEDYLNHGYYHYATGLYNYLLNLATKHPEAFEESDTNNNNQNIKTISDTRVVKWPQIFQSKLQSVEDAFLQSLKLSCIQNSFSYTKVNSLHRNILQEMRQWCKLQLDKIDSQYLFDIYDEEKMKGREDEAHQFQLQKAQMIKNLYNEIAKRLKEFIQSLVNECISTLGKPPCEYAIIGLGSLAREEATPYSDLEFAILIAEEKEEYKIYFRYLTQLLHLKVINLGETILPSMAIPTLNDFYSKDTLANWFYDDITPRGFAFDGSMPQACKTPLGKQDACGKANSYELIHTPDLMIQFLGNKLASQDDNDEWFDKEPQLTMILVTTTLITGTKTLFTSYQAQVVQALEKSHIVTKLPVRQYWAIQLLQGEQLENNQLKTHQVTIMKKPIKGDLKEFEINPYSHVEDGKFYDVKKEIYRFPDRVIERIAIYFGIIWPNVWDRLEILGALGHLLASSVKHLKIITGIAIELRLRTYLAQGSQQDRMDILAYALPQKEQTSLKVIQQMFYLPDLSQLFRFYYTALPFYDAVVDFCTQHSLEQEPSVQESKAASALIKALYYDNRLNVKGHLYRRLLQYQKAKICWQNWLTQNPGDADVHGYLGDTCIILGESSLAIGHLEQALAIDLKIYDSQHSRLTKIYNSLGLAYLELEQPVKAISYLEQALAIDRKTYNDEHPNLATCYNNLGVASVNLSRYAKAVDYFEAALTIKRRIYSNQHPTVSTSLNNLGTAYKELGQFVKAIGYYEEMLSIELKVFGNKHPRVASCYNNLGEIYSQLEQSEKAICYLEQALAIDIKIYGVHHPYVATDYNNLGLTYRRLGQPLKAIGYYEQALAIRRKIYDDQNPSVARCYNNLGMAYHSMGQFAKAIDYLEQALHIYLKNYDEQQPEAAAVYSNLGCAHYELGQFKQSAKYLELALAMNRKIYDDEHSSLAYCYNNLGMVYLSMGQPTKVISYLKQALAIFLKIYGEQHSEVTLIYHNLGNAYYELGQYDKAIKYLELASSLVSSTQTQSDQIKEHYQAQVPIQPEVIPLSSEQELIDDPELAVAIELSLQAPKSITPIFKPPSISDERIKNNFVGILKPICKFNGDKYPNFKATLNRFEKKYASHFEQLIEYAQIKLEKRELMNFDKYLAQYNQEKIIAEKLMNSEYVSRPLL